MIAPTIIIGLGGIGSDICCRVSKQVKDSEQRKRIRFVCIDTDINDLSRRREEDPRIITIQTSAPYMVGNYLDTNTNAKDNWFPVHNILMGKTPTEGAGQVRSISRLAFEEAVRRMLPSGVLGRKMLKKLKVYRGSEHNHAAQNPEVLELRY